MQAHSPACDVDALDSARRAKELLSQSPSPLPRPLSIDQIELENSGSNLFNAAPAAQHNEPLLAAGQIACPASSSICSQSNPACTPLSDFALDTRTRRRRCLLPSFRQPVDSTSIYGRSSLQRATETANTSNSNKNSSVNHDASRSSNVVEPAEHAVQDSPALRSPAAAAAVTPPIGLVHSTRHRPQRVSHVNLDSRHDTPSQISSPSPVIAAAPVASSEPSPVVTVQDHRIEGELWYIAGHEGLSSESTRTMSQQWVVCENQRLSVYSSWGAASRLLADMPFQHVRVLFHFRHGQPHTVQECAVQPATQRSGYGHGMTSRVDNIRDSNNGSNSSSDMNAVRSRPHASERVIAALRAASSSGIIGSTAATPSAAKTPAKSSTARAKKSVRSIFSPCNKAHKSLASSDLPDRVKHTTSPLSRPQRRSVSGVLLQHTACKSSQRRGFYYFGVEGYFTESASVTGATSAGLVRGDGSNASDCRTSTRECHRALILFCTDRLADFKMWLSFWQEMAERLPCVTHRTLFAQRDAPRAAERATAQMASVPAQRLHSIAKFSVDAIEPGEGAGKHHADTTRNTVLARSDCSEKHDEENEMVAPAASTAADSSAPADPQASLLAALFATNVSVLPSGLRQAAAEQAKRDEKRQRLVCDAATNTETRETVSGSMSEGNVAGAAQPFDRVLPRVYPVPREGASVEHGNSPAAHSRHAKHDLHTPHTTQCTHHDDPQSHQDRWRDREHDPRREDEPRQQRRQQQHDAHAQEARDVGARDFVSRSFILDVLHRVTATLAAAPSLSCAAAAGAGSCPCHVELLQALRRWSEAVAAVTRIDMHTQTTTTTTTTTAAAAAAAALTAADTFTSTVTAAEHIDSTHSHTNDQSDLGENTQQGEFDQAMSAMSQTEATVRAAMQRCAVAAATMPAVSSAPAHADVDADVHPRQSVCVDTEGRHAQRQTRCAASDESACREGDDGARAGGGGGGGVCHGVVGDASSARGGPDEGRPKQEENDAVQIHGARCVVGENDVHGNVHSSNAGHADHNNNNGTDNVCHTSSDDDDDDGGGSDAASRAAHPHDPAADLPLVKHRTPRISAQSVGGRRARHHRRIKHRLRRLPPRSRSRSRCFHCCYCCSLARSAAAREAGAECTPGLQRIHPLDEVALKHRRALQRRVARLGAVYASPTDRVTERLSEASQRLRRSVAQESAARRERGADCDFAARVDDDGTRELLQRVWSIAHRGAAAQQSVQEIVNAIHNTLPRGEGNTETVSTTTQSGTPDTAAEETERTRHAGAGAAGGHSSRAQTQTQAESPVHEPLQPGTASAELDDARELAVVLLADSEGDLDRTILATQPLRTLVYTLHNRKELYKSQRRELCRQWQSQAEQTRQSDAAARAVRRVLVRKLTEMRKGVRRKLVEDEVAMRHVSETQGTMDVLMDRLCGRS